jgi:protein-disulfide isomerase
MGAWLNWRGLRAAKYVALPGAILGVFLLAGCSGGFSGLPSLPSFPSLSAGQEAPEQAAEGEKQPAKPVDLAELAKAGPLGDKTLGKANAPVTLVEYASLTCPHCAKFHAETFPKLKKAYIDTGKVRYVFREFPIGRSAAAAAIAVRCAPDRAYFTLNGKFLGSQPQWVAQDVKHDEIYKIVQTAGLKRDKYDACTTNQSINDALYEVKQRGRTLGVSGTPTFFVNGQKAAGALSFEDMSKLIDAALNAPPAPQQPQPQQQAQVQAKPA